MRFLVYSPVQQEDLEHHLGNPEYSYTFLLEKFLPVLKRLGDVTAIRDPEREADALYDEYRSKGEECRLLCFCPPNRAPVGLKCPTTMIVAWEYDTIPDEDWDDDPRNDWRVALKDHGQAIVLSNDSREAVLRAMGPDYPVTVTPAPVYDQIVSLSASGAALRNRAATIQTSGLVVDSRSLRVTTRHLIGEESLALDLASKPWDGSRVTLNFSTDAGWPDYLSVGGFYPREDWGCWSATSDPWIILPFMLRGTIELELCAQGFGHNVGRTVTVSVGTGRSSITLTKEPKIHSFVVHHLESPTNLIKFDGLIADSIPEVGDARTMGVGVRSLTLEQKRGLKTRWKTPTRTVALEGVVYTSVLNPDDGRKNWQDIIKAFCFALNDKPDATLVLKMTRNAHTFIASFMTCLRMIGSTDCRVVAINAFLDDAAYSTLRGASTYYVNASRGEGLCMPLMEFMSAGVPTIAPMHTAMRDYISEDSTFIVDSSVEPAAWPQDRRGRFKALSYKINWESLVQQFQESYRVAASDPERYRRMSVAAVNSQAAYSSVATVERLLQTHLSIEAI